jgi:hypothetical protein
MPKPAAYVVGSNVFRPQDRVSMTYETDYRAGFTQHSKAALAATITTIAAGGSAVEGKTAAEFAKEVHVQLGYDPRNLSTDSRHHYVRHADRAYAEDRVHEVDPSALGGLTIKPTLTVVNPKTREVEEVPRVMSSVDFGHDYPPLKAAPLGGSVHRESFVRHPLDNPETTMSHADRVAINLERSRHKHPLGYLPRQLETEYMAGTVGGLTAGANVDSSLTFTRRDDPTCESPPAHCRPARAPSLTFPPPPADTTASEFAKRTHVRLGYDGIPLSTVQRDTMVRHPQAAYDNPVQSVDPSAVTAGAKDQTRLAVTTATGAVREISRVKSAVDFGHDDQHFISITMGLQHTAQPKMVRQLGVPHALHSYHIEPYVPSYGTLRYSVNEGHPALAKQAELKAEAEVAAAGSALETRLLEATGFFGNRDVAFKARAPGQPPQSMQIAARVLAATRV